jgi:hypothetical protein
MERDMKNKNHKEIILYIEEQKRPKRKILSSLFSIIIKIIPFKERPLVRDP